MKLFSKRIVKLKFFLIFLFFRYDWFYICYLLRFEFGYCIYKIVNKYFLNICNFLEGELFEGFEYNFYLRICRRRVVSSIMFVLEMWKLLCKVNIILLTIVIEFKLLE